MAPEKRGDCGARSLSIVLLEVVAGAKQMGFALMKMESFPIA